MAGSTKIPTRMSVFAATVLGNTCFVWPAAVRQARILSSTLAGKKRSVSALDPLKAEP